MTPEREEEIKQIGEEVNSFINDLSDRHEDIDFSFVELRVENHSDDEKEDKETVLKIEVNDCSKNALNHPKQEDKYFENGGYNSNDAKNKHECTEDTCNDDSDSENETSKNDSNDPKNKHEHIEDTCTDDSGSENETSKKKSNDAKNNDKSDDDATENSKTHKQSNNSRSKSSESRMNEISLQKIIGSDGEVENTVENEDSPKDKKNQNTHNLSEKFNDKNLLSKKGGNKDDLIKDFDDDNRDQQKENIDTSLNKHYNFNDNSIKYIYAPKIDNSRFEIGNSYNGNDNLYHTALRKFMNHIDTIAKTNRNLYANDYVSGLFNTQPNYDYDSYYSVDDIFRNYNDMKNAELAKIYGEYGENESEENYNVHANNIQLN